VEILQHVLKINCKCAHASSPQETKRLDSGYSAYMTLRKDYYVAQRLLCLRYANLEEEHMRDYLQNLKNQYLDGQIG
jgi:DNA mismatch repair protein MSH4